MFSDRSCCSVAVVFLPWCLGTNSLKLVCPHVFLEIELYIFSPGERLLVVVLKRTEHIALIDCFLLLLVEKFEKPVVSYEERERERARGVDGEVSERDTFR